MNSPRKLGSAAMALALLLLAAPLANGAAAATTPSLMTVPASAPARLSSVYDSMPINAFIVNADTMLPSNVAKLEAGKNYTDNVVWTAPPNDGGGKSLLEVGHGVTYSPALFFMNFQQIYDIRHACSLIGPLHYHPHSAESNYVVGPGDGLYFLLLSEDLKRVMFFRAKAGAIVTAPQGWLHLPINTCGATTSLTTFPTSFDPGAVYVPNGPTGDVDFAKVELYGATLAEFKRVWGWLQATPAMNTQPLPYYKMAKAAFDLPGCAAWCKAHNDKM